MFTGIVEEIGTIQKINWGSNSAKLSIQAKKILEDIKIGDSIATNGICLTVTAYSESSFEVDVMPETMKRTTLKQLSVGDLVNLERAMQLKDRFGGHIVSGHIDGIGEIRRITPYDNAILYKIKIDSKLSKYVIEKGSITIDGISLTVISIQNDLVELSIIPITQRDTILKDKLVGEYVNVECDMVGKYIEKLVNTKEKKQKVDMEFLAQNGFS